MQFLDITNGETNWVERIEGIRANAFRPSHAELDEAEELDPANPVELDNEYAEFKQFLSDRRVGGRCCGTELQNLVTITKRCGGV